MAGASEIYSVFIVDLQLGPILNKDLSNNKTADGDASLRSSIIVVEVLFETIFEARLMEDR